MQNGFLKENEYGNSKEIGICQIAKITNPVYPSKVAMTCC